MGPRIIFKSIFLFDTLHTQISIGDELNNGDGDTTSAAYSTVEDNDWSSDEDDTACERTAGADKADWRAEDLADRLTQPGDSLKN